MLIMKEPDTRDILSLVYSMRDIDKKEIACLRNASYGPVAQIETFIRDSDMAYAVRDTRRDTCLCIFGLAFHSEDKTDASPWLLGADLLRLYPVQLLRYSKAFVDMTMEHVKFLYNYVHIDNFKAHEFLEYCGFELSYGSRPHEIGGEPFYFFQRNNLKGHVHVRNS